jgi:hypothetical protein
MYKPLTWGIDAMSLRSGAGVRMLQLWLSKLTAKPAAAMRWVEMRVSAIFGVYKALRKVTVVRASPSGNSISTSPRPNALMQVPSAVRTSWGSIAVNVMNLARSGQKCDVAPESMIAPRCASACGCAHA